MIQSGSVLGALALARVSGFGNSRCAHPLDNSRLILIERWLTVPPIETMDDIAPVVFSASKDEHWVTGVCF